MHCLIAWGEWAVERHQYLNALPGGSGQGNSRIALLHCLGAAGSGTLAMHCLSGWRQWAMHLLQRTASLLRGSGQWNSCNAPPHCLAAVGR